MQKHSGGAWANEGSMKLLLDEISRYEVMSREKEQATFQVYEISTCPLVKQSLKADIINANMRFVLKVAFNYRKVPNIDIMELVSEGKIGLLNAVELFDYRTKNKFISFAVWHIRARVSKYIENNDLIRIPSQKKLLLNRKKKELGVDNLDEANHALHILTSNMASLDAIIGENDLTFGDTIEDDTSESPADIVMRNQVTTGLAKTFQSVLSKEETTVLSCLYGIGCEPMGLKETKDVVGKSHERVRQIRDAAFKKLRKQAGIKELRELVGEL
jgi:RNA polymerase primary sigma factor